MREVTASGHTVEEAVQSALEQLNTTRDQAEIEVIDEGKKGLLGVFGTKLAVVKAVKISNPVEETAAFLEDVVKKMNVEAAVKAIVTDNHVTYELSGETIAILIGKRGQTLNALQYIVHLALNKGQEQFYSVTVDAEGYRGRRKETLESLALKMAEKAEALNKKVALDPMPAFERKIIHNALQQKAVKTYSSGDEPHRHIVIQPS